MNTFRQIIILILFFLISGCTVISSKNPIGMQPIKLNADEWNGYWFSDPGKQGDVLFVKVIDSEKGILRIGSIKGGGKDEMFLKKFDVFLKSDKNSSYFNVPAEQILEKDSIIDIIKGTYLFAKFEKSGDQLILWGLNDSIVVELIEKGKLKGTIYKGDDAIVIEEHSDKVTRVINENESEIIEWGDPAIFIRFKKK